MSDIVFVVDHLDTGGAPVVVRDLCVALDHIGVKVTLIVLSDRRTLDLPGSVTLIRLPFSSKTWWQRQKRYAYHARQLDALLSELKLTEPSLVVAHLHHAHQVVSRSQFKNIAWYCLHADPEIGFLGNKQGWGRMRKRRKVHNLYQGRRLIGVSQGVLDSLSRAFGVTGSANVALHNPIDLETITGRSQEVVDDVPEDYLLFVGRLEQRQKRFDRLLQAYQESGLDVPLVLVGEGAALTFIESEVDRLGLQEHVILLGRRDNPYAYMRRARALVLSSDYEGFPLVVIEALACGTPVVSTDCPSGPREVLKGELARYLVPMDDVSAFAGALRDVISRPPEILSATVAHLSAERVARRYLELADKVPGTHSMSDKAYE